VGEVELSTVEKPGLKDAIHHARRVLTLAWQTAPGLMVTLAVMTLFAALGPALAAYLGKLIIDGVLAAIADPSPQARNAVIMWVVLEAGLLGLLLADRRLMAFQKRVLQAQLGQAVSRAIFTKTLKLDLQTLEDASTQQQILLARQHATSRPYSLVVRVIELAQHFITLTSFALVLMTFSPWLIVLVIAGGLPLFLSETRFAGTVFRLLTGRTPEMRQRNYLEGLMLSDGSAPERIHADANAAIFQRYRDLFDSLFKEDMATHRRQAWLGAALISASSVVFIAGKVWIVLAAIASAITVGTMTMHVAIIKQAQNTVTALLGALNGGYADLLYVSNLYALLNLADGTPRGTATAGPAPGDGYRLEAVSFTYPNAKRPAVHDLTVHITEGMALGIAGSNGSGKTTLVKLLTGLYTPSQGRILLDGLPLQDWSPEALYARTAVLFQPFQRYRMTAGDNIAMGTGLRDTDPEHLREAAIRGLAQPVLDDLPDGLNTRLSRQFLDGRELSGGQWQRLALARAMLRTQAQTLILDEPTSALDPAAEGEFIRAASADDRTTILISHRLANLRGADLILVLEKGEITERGTHDQLLAKGGRYKAMFEGQAEFYRNG
jgi:ABC-type multidrug transport system fused ATPase/permease subunit